MSNVDLNEMPDCARSFLNYMITIKGKSINTVHEYFFDLRLFFRFLKKSRKLVSYKIEFDQIAVNDISIDLIKTVTLIDLYDYLTFVTTERNNSNSSRARKVASLKSFFNYCCNKMKWIESNPTVELESPKINKRLPKYLSIDESVSLLNSIDGDFKERDFCIITLFLNCGMRLSELVGINISRISGDTLTVIGKGNKERTVYLDDACLNAVNAYLKVRPVSQYEKNALFLSKRLTRISPKTVQYIVKKYIVAAGLDPEKYSTHKLRHTAATLMYKYGNVDIRSLQSILGHESVATTEIYTHVDNEDLRDAAKRNPLANFKTNNSSNKEEP